MNIHLSRLTVVGLSVILIGTACQSKAATPQVDTMATAVAQAASVLLTQTAAAASPTPLPPTVTLTPSPTATETVTPTLSGPPRRPQTENFAACYLGGPGGKAYQLDSNISKGKGVELLGLGNVPGWYVIRNPYFHRPCWIAQADLKIFPGTDITTYPVMTPGIPPMGS